MKKILFFAALIAASTLVYTGCTFPIGDEPENPSGGGGGGGSSSSVAVNGCLPGKFSVSPSNKVSFSQGNLVYKASENRYRFHLKQYQIIGGEYSGNVFHDGIRCRNEDASKTYDGWIDLFGWGTANQPWARGDAAYAQTSFQEWGDKSIENGGGANAWRTLSASEWQYLLKERPDAAQKVGFCVMKKALYTNIYLERNEYVEDWVDHNAMLLIPDNWTCPSGITFIPIGAQSEWDWTNSSSEWDNNGLGWWGSSSYSNTIPNDYKISELEKLEASGVVILPATGFVWADGHYSYSSDQGGYWSCNKANGIMQQELEGAAYAMEFKCLYPAVIEPATATGISVGCAVRLVKDVK